MKANPRRSAPLSTLLFGSVFLILGAVNLAGGVVWRGIGFGAIGLAALLGSPQAHRLLGVDEARRWTALRVIALVLVVVSVASFVAMVVQGLS